MQSCLLPCTDTCRSHFVDVARLRFLGTLRRRCVTFFYFIKNSTRICKEKCQVSDGTGTCAVPVSGGHAFRQNSTVHLVPCVCTQHARPLARHTRRTVRTLCCWQTPRASAHAPSTCRMDAARLPMARARPLTQHVQNGTQHTCASGMWRAPTVSCRGLSKRVGRAHRPSLGLRLSTSRRRHLGRGRSRGRTGA
jgi:hypothetical protein